MKPEELDFCANVDVDWKDRYDGLGIENSYPYMGARWAVIYNKVSGLSAYVENGVCHGGTAAVSPHLRKTAIAIKTYVTPTYEPTRFVSVYSEEFKRNFYNWAFNDSPYSEAFITKDYDEALAMGGALLEPKTPSGILLGGLILTRYLHEVYTRTGEKGAKFFVDMVEAGVEYTLACILGHTISSFAVNTTSGKRVFLTTFARAGWGAHSPFTGLGLNKNSYRAMLNKRNRKDQTLWSEGGYGGVFDTYLNTDKPFVLGKGLGDKLTAFLGKPAKTLVWGDVVKTYDEENVPTPEALNLRYLEWILEWQKEASPIAVEEVA